MCLSKENSSVEKETMENDNSEHHMTLVERIQQDFPNTPSVVVPMHRNVSNLCAKHNQQQERNHNHHYADIGMLIEAMTTTAEEHQQNNCELLGARTEAELTAVVARMGRRQQGSRMLQELLRTLPSGDAARLRTALVHALPALWADPFGNYAAQALFDTAAGAQAASRVLTGHVAALSFDAYGCRVVQRALQCTGVDTAAALAGELRGRVCACARDACGNHVLQRVAECVPLHRAAFVPAELCAGGAAMLARDRCACRVLQRLLEHGTSALLAPLLRALVAALPALLAHPYGCFVAQSVAAHGAPEHCTAVLAAARGRVVALTRHPRAWCVLEAAVAHAPSADFAAATVLPELAGPRGDGAPLLAVLDAPGGARVVVCCLEHFPLDARTRLVALLQRHAPLLQQRPHCKDAFLALGAL